MQLNFRIPCCCWRKTCKRRSSSLLWSWNRLVLVSFFSISNDNHLVFTTHFGWIAWFVISSRFITGFLLGAIPWYIAVFIQVCGRINPREKHGYVACTIAVSLSLNNHPIIIIMYCKHQINRCGSLCFHRLFLLQLPLFTASWEEKEPGREVLSTRKSNHCSPRILNGNFLWKS